MDEIKIKQQVKRAKWNWNTIIFSIIATIVIISLIGFEIFRYKRTFTAEKWLNAPNYRTNIVNDLLEKHKLIGMTEEEIISLLGEEENYANSKTSFKISKDYYEPENTIVYYLGVDYMDDRWLIISIDKGIVRNYCIDVT